MQMNGMAHITIVVSNFKECSSFYRKLFEFLEMKLIFDSSDVLYGVGGRTGVAVKEAAHEFRHETFEQNRIGLHHFCFRARSREDVDELHKFLQCINTKIIRSPGLGQWAKGYYSILFEDPDGIRIEANYVPGQGNLDPSVDLPLPAINV